MIAASTIARSVGESRGLRLPRRRGGFGLVAGVLLAILVSGARAQDANPVENQVKAAFLARFPIFVEWPAGTFAQAQDPIIIGVVGLDPFGRSLDEAVQKARVEGRPLALKRFKDVSVLEPCHLLFVSASEQRRLGEILRRLEGSAVLIVGDSEKFAQSGGMINFVKEAGKVRFEINLEVVKRAGLKLSPKLVQVSKVVGGDPLRKATP